MKKIVVWILVIMLFLTACSQSGGTDETTSLLQTMDTLPDAPFPVLTDPGNSLIEYDPDRQIYFSCRNLDYDIYLDMSCAPFLNIRILSKNALNIETVQANIPIQNGYSILIAESNDEFLGQLSTDDSIMSGYVFKPYLYQSYEEKSWKDGEDAALSEVYSRLTPEDLPQFHVYHVTIMFEKTVGGDEAFQDITLTIDGKDYPLSIGEIWLHEKAVLNYPDDQWLDGGISTQSLIVDSHTMLYNDGIDQICPAFDFTAAYDMELLDLYLLDPKIDILDVRLVINSQKGSSMDFYWDRKSPVYLESGDHVWIYVYYRDERQDTLDYTAKAWPVIDYKCELGYYSAFTECTLCRELNLYELYAIVFDGVDLESYYRDYYFPKYESWRQDYAS